VNDARRLLLAVVTAIAQIACEPDPARSVKIPRASSTAAPEVNPAIEASGALRWNPALCPPPIEPAGGPSTLVGTGACAFQQRGAAHCILTDDDLLMEVTRPMAGDARFMVYVSVENFWEGHDNANGQVVVGVESPQGLYRWRTDTARLANAPDESFVVMDQAHLSAVPPLKAPDVIVSGTFTCGSIERQP
jgi:hypothetical protein